MKRQLGAEALYPLSVGPRRWGHGIHVRARASALDLLEGLIEATYRREAAPILRRVNLLLERFRMLVRLARDLGYLDLRHYEHVARNEVGW